MDDELAVSGVVRGTGCRVEQARPPRDVPAFRSGDVRTRQGASIELRPPLDSGEARTPSKRCGPLSSPTPSNSLVSRCRDRRGMARRQGHGGVGSPSTCLMS